MCVCVWGANVGVLVSKSSREIRRDLQIPADPILIHQTGLGALIVI